MISSRDLAKRYDAYLHAQLMGDNTEGADFGLWLDAHWSRTAELPDEPCSGDRADHERAGGPISWIDGEELVIGLLTGRSSGAYLVPIRSEPPAVTLYLDDAEGCSTGSLYQERAFVDAAEAVIHEAIAAESLWPVSSPLIMEPAFSITPELPPDAAFGESAV